MSVFFRAQSKESATMATDSNDNFWKDVEQKQLDERDRKAREAGGG